METPIWLSSPDRNCASVDVNTMYPESGDLEAEEIAKNVCTGGGFVATRQCVFIDLCRDYAIKAHEQGTWGNTTEKDRRTIVRKLQRNRHGQRST